MSSILSMPGYGFSEQPKQTGWNADRHRLAWDVLMKRLGYKRYVSQGGDWGSVVADKMAHQAPAGLLGIHVNMPATVPADVARAMSSGDPAPPGLPKLRGTRTVVESLSLFSKNGAYGAMMTTRPQTVGYGCRIRRSAWLPGCTTSSRNGRIAAASRNGRSPRTRCWTTYAVLADQQRTSSARLYWENGDEPNNFNAVEDLDLAPGGDHCISRRIYRAPETMGRARYHKLIYFNEVDKRAATLRRGNSPQRSVSNFEQHSGRCALIEHGSAFSAIDEMPRGAGSGNHMLTSGLNDFVWAGLRFDFVSARDADHVRGVWVLAGPADLERALRGRGRCRRVRLARGHDLADRRIWAPDGVYSRIVSPAIGLGVRGMVVSGGALDPKSCRTYRMVRLTRAAIKQVSGAGSGPSKAVVVTELPNRRQTGSNPTGLQNRSVM